MASGDYRLLDRQAAKAVLRDMVGGLENRIGDEERQQTLNTISDALAKLSGYKSLEAFFESGYYLDVYGYKLSGRNQLVDPEILYNTAALNAAILNRIEELRGPQMGLEELAKLLLQQEQDARAVLEPPAVKADMSERARMSRAAAKAKEKKKTKNRRSLSDIMARVPAIAWLSSDRGKFISVMVLIPIALIGLYLGSKSGVVASSASATVIADAPLHFISPILLQGWKINEMGATKLKANIMAEKWDPMEMWERNKAAEQIHSKLKAESYDSATIMIFRSQRKAMEIDKTGIVFVEKR